MDFDQITVKDSPGLCRCCLSEGCYKDLAAEYNWMGDNEVYADMLLECFDIGISQHMDGPNGPSRLICEVCITRLRDACNFKKQVVASEKKFIDMLGRGEFQSKVMAYEADMKVEPPLDLQTEDGDDGIEYLEEIDFDDDEPLKNLASTSKSAEISPTKRGRGRPKKSEGIPEKKPKTSKDDQKKVSKNKTIVKDEKPSVVHPTMQMRRWKNLETLFNKTSLIPFKWNGGYQCCFCSTLYKDYNEFRKHATDHRLNFSENCFVNLKMQYGDFDIKVDVSRICCEICVKSFESVDLLSLHMITHNLDYDVMTNNRIKEYFLKDLHCMKCGDKFTSFEFLDGHVFRNCEKFKIEINLDSSPIETVIPKSLDAAKAADHSGLKIDEKYYVSSSEEHKCPCCLQNFTSKVDYFRHVTKCTVKILPPTTLPDTRLFLREHIEKSELKLLRDNVECILTMTNATPFRYRTNFICYHCSLSFVDFEILKVHREQNHSGPKLDMETRKRICTVEIFTLKLDVTSLCCKVCNKAIADIHMLIEHLITDHKANYDRNVNDFIRPFKICAGNNVCPRCPKAFADFGKMLMHFQREHGSHNILCIDCGESFSRILLYRCHLDRFHADKNRCECGLEFDSSTELQQHRKSAHGYNSFKCTNCSECFTSAWLQSQHLKRAHGWTGHLCRHCGKSFRRQCDMHKHVARSHNKERNFICCICHKSFYDEVLLKMHMTKHPNE